MASSEPFHSCDNIIIAWLLRKVVRVFRHTVIRLINISMGTFDNAYLFERFFMMLVRNDDHSYYLPSTSIIC